VPADSGDAITNVIAKVIRGETELVLRGERAEAQDVIHLG
jgi:hypothetical protein